MQNLANNPRALFGILMWVGVFAAFYFMIIRPQKQKEKKLHTMREELQVGDKILTLGGIIATISKIADEEVVIELGPSRTKVPIKKWGIGQVVEKRSDKSELDTTEAEKLNS